MSKKRMSVWVYCLKDHEGIVRYVGQSNCVERRYLEHLCDANEEAKSMKRRWLAEHLGEHGLPSVELLAVCPLSRANEIETKHQLMHKATVMQGDVRAVVHDRRHLHRRSRRKAESPGSQRYRRVQFSTVVNMLKKCRFEVDPHDAMRAINELRSQESIEPMKNVARKPRRPRGSSKAIRAATRRVTRAKEQPISARVRTPDSMLRLAEKIKG